MKLYISTDKNGDIHISDEYPIFFPVRFKEIDFPPTSRERHIIIDIEKYDYHWHSFWSNFKESVICEECGAHNV